MSCSPRRIDLELNFLLTPGKNRMKSNIKLINYVRKLHLNTLDDNSGFDQFYLIIRKVQSNPMIAFETKIPSVTETLK